MTTAPITPGNSYYDTLVERCGVGFANDILNLINNRIDVRTPEIISEMFNADREVLAGLAQRVQELHARHGSLPAVRQAAASVAQVTEAHNGTDPASESEVEADAVRTQRAAEEVERVERELDGAPASSGSQPERPAAAPTSRPSTGTSRSGDIEGLRGEVAGLCGRLDQVETCQDELQVVSATAFASATVNTDGRAARWSMWSILIGIAVGFLLYCTVVGIDNSITWGWNWAIALPAILGALTGAVVFLVMREVPPSSETVASAEAIVARWNQRAEVQSEPVGSPMDHFQGEPQVSQNVVARAQAR